jgi:hypothetical protein
VRKVAQKLARMAKCFRYKRHFRHFANPTSPLANQYDMEVLRII